MAASRRDRAHTRRTVPDVIPNLLGLLRQYRDRYHELALLVSPMSQAEFEELVRSIARVGLLNTIKMLNGKVIDGIDLGMTFSMAPAAYGNRAFVLSDGGAWLSLHVSPPLRSGG